MNNAPIDCIDLYLEVDGQEGMPPVISAETVLHVPEGGVDEVIALRVAYADGTVVTMPYRTDGGVLDVVMDEADEFSIVRRNAAAARDLGLDAVVDAIKAWIAVEVQTRDEDGNLMHDLRIEGRALIVEYGDDVPTAIPLADNGQPLRAIWLGDALLGFVHSDDEAWTVVHPPKVDALNARLAIVASRLAGEWQVVKDECVRLGSLPPTNLKIGEPVKIGFQPVHPLPGDIRAEWMWVVLTGVEDGGARLKGTLANEPECFDIDLSLGDEIEFSNRDVYASNPTTVH